MTMPPLHHGRGDTASPRMRRVFTFLGVTVACALIGFWSLRLLGVERGEASLPLALGVVALASVAAAVITRAVGRR